MAINPVSASSAVMKPTMASAFEGIEVDVPFKEILAQVQQPQPAVDYSAVPKQLPQFPIEALHRHMTPQQLASFVAEMVPMPEDKRKQKQRISGVQNLDAKRDAGMQGQDFIAQGIDPMIQDPAAINPQSSLAPVSQTTPYAQSNPYLVPRSSHTTPFQFFIEKSLDYFRKVSGMEMKTDRLMVDYIEGRATIEELTIEKAKVSVALSFAVTIIQQVTNAFNEMKNMSI